MAQGAGSPPPERAATPMHVLLVHQLFVLGGEAGGTRHVELVRHLLRRGHRFTVVTSPLSYLSGERHGAGIAGWTGSDPGAGGAFRLIRSWTYAPARQDFVGRTLSFISFTLSSLIAALRVPGVDVVWGTSPPIFQALGALLAARVRGVRFVLEVRDLWPDFAVELGVIRSPALISMARWAERLLYRQADGLVVNSPGFVDHLVARGAPRERIRVVPNAVEVADFDPAADGASFREELGVSPETALVVYTGAHGIPNDLDLFLDAAARLRHRDALFLLVGAGRDKSRLVARAGEMGLANVRFLDPRPKDSMPTVLAASTVCVAILKPIPLFTTTYPNKVFDYMAAGRPTVLAIDGVIRNVLEEADGGTFARPGDATALATAIDRYLGDRALGRAHGANARRHVEAHFARGGHADALGEVLVSAVWGGSR